MDNQYLRIVFLGTPDFAVESLDTLVREQFNIVGVVTMPDKPAGRGHKLLQSPVKQYCLAHGLNLLQPTNLKDPAFIEQLHDLRADLFIVIAFRMLPQVVWQMPPLGTFNLHASLLPRYRGAAPINRAIMNGETETGVTTFMLKHEIDTGDILSQERISIGPDENAGDIHDKLMHLGARLTLKTVNDILQGTLTSTPQDMLLHDEEPTPAPKIFKEDCMINWSRTACEVHNHVRGLSPYPAAWTTIQFGDSDPTTVKITHVTPLPDRQSVTPGHVTITRDSILIDCSDHPVSIDILQPAGKRSMPANDFIRGLNTDQASITI